MIHKITLVIDPNSGFGALYLDGIYIYDWGLRGPEDNTDIFHREGSWSDAMEVLAEKMGFDFETETRFQPSQKFEGPDYTEWDTYWPEKLEDVPLPPPEWFQQWDPEYQPPTDDSIFEVLF